MRTLGSRTWLGALLAAALLSPVAASATTGWPDDPGRARELKDRAVSLFSEPKSWGEAAALLEQSAQLRSAADAEAYECLVSAGRIRAALRQPEKAQRLFEQAAAHALARGAVIEAANAYMDAAFSAQAAKRGTDAVELVEKVRLLSNSPLLAEAQRELLQSRLQ